MLRRIAAAPVTNLLLLGLLALTGCSAKSYTGPVPADTVLRPLPALDHSTPLVWHPTGRSISGIRNGLIHHDLVTGISSEIDTEQPDRLAWAPDGEELATAYRLDGETRISIIDSDGTERAATTLPGELDALLWSRDAGLLVITSRLKIYSFGGDLRLDLIRWDGIDPPRATLLHNTTIKPATAQAWSQGLLPGSRATLSPDQDELLYLRLHDPPAFPSSIRLALRHIETGAEKTVTSLAINARSIDFIDSDRILADSGRGTSLELPLWTGAKGVSRPHPGTLIRTSPAGHYWLLGDRLLHDGEEIGRFPDLKAATFSPDGSRLLLQIGQRWHMLEGLQEPEPPALTTDQQSRLRQLRNWRSRGLITSEEYVQQKAKVTQP